MLIPNVLQCVIYPLNLTNQRRSICDKFLKSSKADCVVTPWNPEFEIASSAVFLIKVFNGAIDVRFSV